MEPDELESFRKKWLRELQTKSSDPAIQSKKKRSHEGPTDSPTCSVDRTDEDKVFRDYKGSKPPGSSKRLKESYFRQPKDSSQKCEENILPSSDEKAYGKYAAFDIANDYLNFNNNDCKYCISQNEHSTNKISHKLEYKCTCSNEEGKASKRKYNKSYKMLLKRQYEFSQFGEEKGRDEAKENLVDLLIADIDEITCIPFFDIELPLEIAVRIFQYLSIKDLFHCCAVNSRWRRLAQDDLIWFNLCEKLDVDKGVRCVADRQNWNQYVKETVLERCRIQSKWKERCCEVRDLGGWDEDLVLCAAEIHNNNIATSYLDGSIRLWNLSTGKCGENLKEKHSNIEDVVLSICSCIHLNQHLCIAGFENGDVMVWKLDDHLCGQLIFMENYSNCISFVLASNDGTHFLTSYGSKIILVGKSDNLENDWNWRQKYVHDTSEVVRSLMLVDTILSQVTIIASTDNRLTVNVPTQQESTVLDLLTGATFSSIDYKKSFVVAGISGFGYSILDGYRIRKYCVQTGKQVGNIIGSQTGIMCLNYADCYENQVVVGCADCSIRIHDFKDESLLVEISGGIDSSITCIQMDKWKVVCGYQNGMLSLWDRSKGTKCWQTQASKHPVRIARFDDQLLTTVCIPEDKFKERIYYFEEKPANRQKQQGCIRVMDFTKDNITVGVPDVCRAEYDDIAGYDYNIELIAPYDDVQTLQLPKI